MKRWYVLLITLYPALILAEPNITQGIPSAIPSIAQNGSNEIRALLSPVIESTLSSQIAGRIAAINIKDGERFSKGMKLLEFDCDVQKAQLRQARAEALAARKKHEANMRLQEFNSVSQLQIDTSAAEVEMNNAKVAVMKAKVDMCDVSAPFDGRVAKVKAKVFESVNQGQPLIEILDDSHLKVQLYVPSKWLSWLSASTTFKIRIDETGKDYTAKVTQLGAKVDAVSQSLEITAIIEGNHPELLAGMSGSAIFPVPK